MGENNKNGDAAKTDVDQLRKDMDAIANDPAFKLGANMIQQATEKTVMDDVKSRAPAPSLGKLPVPGIPNQNAGPLKGEGGRSA